MANPTPRTVAQIIGEMLDTFQSRTGLPNPKVSGPLISVIEAAATSDFRTGRDVFDLLRAITLEYTEGSDLDAVGNSEGKPRRLETRSTGDVTVSDPNYTKISTTLHATMPAPLVGATTLYLTDGNSFPQPIISPPVPQYIYLGRDTSRVEGPIQYSGVVYSGGHWVMSLSTPLTKYHPAGEAVVLAQGGRRTIPAGYTAQTAQAGNALPVRFSTQTVAYLEDGETSVAEVPVMAQVAGVAGNVEVGGITEFSAPPFSRASVTNPLRFTNGRATEGDPEYRERIKIARRTKALGSPLALTTNAIGVEGDDGAICSSAALLPSVSGPSTLFVDDGTGYIEKIAGVSYESLVGFSVGGERDFQLAQTPITKGRIEASIAPTYVMTDACSLAFRVGGIVTQHDFVPGDFFDPNSAGLQEVLDLINQDAELGWKAQPTIGGKFVVTALDEINDDIELVPLATADASTRFGFAAGKALTLSLYQDDVLLDKDGKLAMLESRPFTEWSETWASPTTAAIAVDGISIVISIIDQMFIDANTGYVSVGKNSLAAWVAVFNANYPGITATATADTLVIASNRGRSSLASLAVTTCGLVTKNMFEIGSSTGKNLDYSLERGSGRIRLTNRLPSESKLTAGSSETRARILTPSFSAWDSGTTTPSLWMTIDQPTEVVPIAITPSTPVVIKAHTTPFGNVTCLGALPGLTALPFGSVARDDRLILWDAAFNSAFRDIDWEVHTIQSAGVDPPDQYVFFDTPCMGMARAYHTATLLASGKVLLAGGYSGFGETHATATCELYDPTTGVFTPTGFMSVPRARHTACLVTDGGHAGEVMVVGGVSAYDGVALATTEFYNATTGLWTAGPSILSGASVVTGRVHHGMVSLYSGNILVAGGINQDGAAVNHLPDSTLWDCSTNKWGVPVNMALTGDAGNRGVSKFSLLSISTTSDVAVAIGGVRVAAGVEYLPTYNFQTYTASASPQWTAASGAGHAHTSKHSCSAVLLSTSGNGLILVAGGDTALNGATPAPQDTSMTLDFTGELVTTLGAMGFARSGSLIHFNSVSDIAYMVFGKMSDYHKQMEFINLVGTAWAFSSEEPLGTDMARIGAAGAILNDGTWLITGGQTDEGEYVDRRLLGVPIASAEIYNIVSDSWSAIQPGLTASLVLPNNGVSAVRGGRPQKIEFAPGIYNPTILAAAIDAQLVGAHSNVYQSDHVRIITDNQQELTGDVMVAAIEPPVDLLDIPADVRGLGHRPHLAVVQSNADLMGTPTSVSISGTTVDSAPVVTYKPTVSFDELYGCALGLARTPDGCILDPGMSYHAILRGSNNLGHKSPMARLYTSLVDSGVVVTLRDYPVGLLAPSDGIYLEAPLAIGPNDTLDIEVDQDADTKHFIPKMYRRLSTVGDYGQVISVTDQDATLASWYVDSTHYDFDDHAVYMQAHARTHPNDANLRTVWRYGRFGLEGERATVKYEYPILPSQPLVVAVDNITDEHTNVAITLASGASRNFPLIRGVSKMGMITTAIDAVGGVATVKIILGYKILTAAYHDARTVILTITLPAGVSEHGIVASNWVYVTSSDSNFSSGYYQVETASVANSIKVNWAVTPGASATNPGWISFDENLTSFGDIVADDMIRFGTTTGMNSFDGGKCCGIVSKVEDVDAMLPYVVTMRIPDSTMTTTPSLKPLFYSVLFPTAIDIWANPKQSIDTIVGDVNVKYAAGTSPIFGAAIGAVTTTQVINPTWVEKDNSTDYNGLISYNFVDGLNWVSLTSWTYSAPSTYTLQFSLKRPIAWEIANNDWANDELRLAPVHAGDVTAWLNHLNVTGLSECAEIIETASRAVQITGNTIGSDGSVEITATPGNQISASVVGSGFATTGVITYSSPPTRAYNPMVRVTAAEGANLTAGQWVSISNALAQWKPFSAATTTLASLDSAGIMTFGVTQPWTLFSDSTALTPATLQVAKQGKLIRLYDLNKELDSMLDFTQGTLEGGYIYLEGSTKSTNNGVFAIVRAEATEDNHLAVWIDNPEAIETDSLAFSGVSFIRPESIVPGDILHIATTLWGADTVGDWLVTAFGADETKIIVSRVDGATIVPIVSPKPALGVEYPLVQVTGGVQAKWFKQIYSIAPYLDDITLLEVKFAPEVSMFGSVPGDYYWHVYGLGYSQWSDQVGTTLTALNKLEFPVGLLSGTDGYSYSTGMIGEVNKVLRGVPKDPDTYPGVLAEQARMNIAPADVHRIQLSLFVRLQPGYNSADVGKRIRSAITDIINRAVIGESISLSSLIRAADKIAGVGAITVLSPTYTSTQDYIVVLPNEKPMIVDMEADISLTFASE